MIKRSGVQVSGSDIGSVGFAEGEGACRHCVEPGAERSAREQRQVEG
jgi:hypothetical protein